MDYGYTSTPSAHPSVVVLESITLQNAANPLPRQEWAVALNAPGKYESGSAPILFARTTARAEFCIPVSIDIVRAVCSEKPNAYFGTMYPAAKPSECVYSIQKCPVRTKSVITRTDILTKFMNLNTLQTHQNNREKETGGKRAHRHGCVCDNSAAYQRH